MPFNPPDHTYLYVTSRQLRDNYARVMRILKEGDYKGAIVIRRGREVAILHSLERRLTPDEMAAARGIAQK